MQNLMVRKRLSHGVYGEYGYGGYGGNGEYRYGGNGGYGLAAEYQPKEDIDEFTALLSKEGYDKIAYMLNGTYVDDDLFKIFDEYEFSEIKRLNNLLGKITVFDVKTPRARLKCTVDTYINHEGIQKWSIENVDRLSDGGFIATILDGLVNGKIIASPDIELCGKFAPAFVQELKTYINRAE